MRAAAAFAQLPEAASLAAANKRIGNLLKKAEGDIGGVNDAALVEPAEKALAAAVAALRPQAEAQLAAGDFAGSLSTLAWPRPANPWTRSLPTSWSWPKTRPCAPTAWLS